MSMTFDQLAAVTKNSSLLKDRSKGVQVTKLGIEEVEPYGLTDLFTTNGKYLTWVNTDEQGNAHVSCSCDFFRYVAEYALAQVDASVILYSNGQPPKEKNPEQIPVLCKHLLKIYDERGPLGIGFHPPEPEEEEKEPVSEDYLKEVVEMEKEQGEAPAPAEGEAPPPEVPEEAPEPEAPPAEPEPAVEEEEPAPEGPDVTQPAQPEPPAEKPEEGEVIPEELIEEAEAEVQPEKHHEKKEEKKKEGSLLTREAMRSLKVKYDMIQREKEKGRKSRPKNRMNYMKKQRNPSIRDHKRDLDNPKEIHATLAEFLLPMSVDADAAAREAAHRISELDVSVDVVVEPVTQKDMKKLQVQYNPAGTDDPIKVVKAVASLVDALFAGRF